MKELVLDVLGLLLGRHISWRFARSLYMKARGDSPNDIQSNGEKSLQRQMLTRFSATKERVVVFDIGANIGNWTLSILQEALKLGMGKQLKVHSFEPVASTFSILRSRIISHDLRDCVILLPQAMSIENGTTTMYIAGDGAATNSLHFDPMNKNNPSIQVDMVTGDSYCSINNIEIVHYIKCDTEGHDVEVLCGFQKLFGEQRILACQFEYNHRWVYSRHYLKDVFDMFNDNHYKIGKITATRIELFHEWNPELERFFEGNYIVLHPEALDWFTSIIGTFNAHNVYSAHAGK